MTRITNIQHFLSEGEEPPDLPPEANELLKFLTAIIEAATLEYERPVTLSSRNCMKVVNGRPCSGDIEVWVFAENNEIGWECTECGDDGIITNWESTPWDKRKYTRH